MTFLELRDALTPDKVQQFRRDIAKLPNAELRDALLLLGVMSEILQSEARHAGAEPEAEKYFAALLERAQQDSLLLAPSRPWWRRKAAT